MSEFSFKNGLDLPIAGEATGDVVDLAIPETVAYSPTEFRGLKPRLLEREGSTVKAGTPLFHDKIDPRIVFRSPAAGTLQEVRRGARRVITDVVIRVEGDEAESLPSWKISDLSSISREEAMTAALGSGHWCALKTRPMDKMADPAEVPQAILVAATETGPLQPGADELLASGDTEALQAALYVLKALTDGEVHFTTMRGYDGSAGSSVAGAQRHRFSGPHPAGDPGVQVNHVTPPRGSGVVWTIRAWDAVALGRTLLTGRFDATRVYAAVGTGVVEPRLVRTLLGAPLQHITGETHEDSRWIRGSVLTGETVEESRWAAYHARAVHVLPEEVRRDIMGWATPQLGAWSFHRAFLSGFFKSSSRKDLRPGIYGGHRAIVPIGVYKRVVVTPDVLPEFLFKSIVAGDLEEAIQLGLLDVTQEEAALCSYICPSKIDFDCLLREDLDLYERES